MKKDTQSTPSSSKSRRDFCKSSLLVAGGIMAAPLSAQASAFVGGSDTLKVALIGCGGRGTGAAAQALSTTAPIKLVAMADAFSDRLEKSLDTLKKKFKDSDRLAVADDHKFVGFDAYKKAIASADVVILATPPGFRPSHFEAAVNAGKHIFMEKPVATDAPGIRQVLAAAEEAKKKKLNVVVGLQRHYQDSYRQAYQRIQDGAIGDIVSGQVYWNSEGVWVKPREEGQTEMEYQMRNWYYFNWLCGDHIVEQHIHNLDVANWFIGDYPATAQGMGGREVRTGKEYGEIFDHHFVEFVYPNGAVISSQCRHQPGTLKRVSESFQGTKGRIETNGGNMAKLTDYKGGLIYEHPKLNQSNPYQVEHDELFAAILSGDKVINNAEYGAKSTMTAIMGRMATYSGKLLTWEEVMNSKVSLLPETLAWDAKPPILPDEEGFYPVPVPGETEVLNTGK